MDAIQQYLDGGGAVLGLRTSNMHSSSAGRALPPVEPVVRRPRPRIPLDQPLRPQLPHRRYRDYGCATGVRRRDPGSVHGAVVAVPDRARILVPPILSGTPSTRRPRHPRTGAWCGKQPDWSRSGPSTYSRSMPAGLTPPRSWLRCSASVEPRCTADPSRLSSAASSAATLRRLDGSTRSRSPPGVADVSGANATLANLHRTEV